MITLNMKKNTFYGILYGASGSLWWGTIGVIYFKSSSFAGPIELVVHRTIWTAFSLIINTSLFNKWDIFFKLIKKKKELFYLLLTGILIFTNLSTWIYAVVTNKIVDASFGYFIMPILSVFLGILFLKESYNKQKILSVTLVIVSIIYLLFNYSSVPWVGLIVGITWSFYSFLRKKIKSHNTSLAWIGGPAIEPELSSSMYSFFRSTKPTSKNENILECKMTTKGESFLKTL